MNYTPDMDDRLADLLNIGWAGLRGFTPIYPRGDKWPVADAELLAKWRAKGKLTAEGTFIAEHDDGTLAAVFAMTPGAEDVGTFHFFCVNAHYGGRGYGSRTLAAAEEYLRECGMKHIITSQVDSRCPARNGFLRKKGYYVKEPDHECIIMLQQPDAQIIRNVSLPDTSYAIESWRDDLLDTWVELRNAIFDGEQKADFFLENFRNRHDFDPDGWKFLRHADKYIGITGAMICRNEDMSLRGGIIEWVGVLPEYRGKKLGKALMHEALNHFVTHDISPVVLVTQPFRKPAVALYEQLGFRIEAETPQLHKEL